MTHQPPPRPAAPGRHLTLVAELLRRWDDRDPPTERFTSREEEERTKRARAAALLTLPDPDPCADCPDCPDCAEEQAA
jgi:hypothetical protein